MGNDQYEAIKAALVACGLVLCKVDGKWETVEKPGGISGLPAKLKVISMKFVEKKLKGSPGRGASGGFNLQTTLAMSNSDYDLVYADAKVILHRIHGIKMNEAITKQDRTVVEHAIKKLVAVHSEFEVYHKVGLWPAWDFFQMILWVWANKYQQALKNLHLVKTRKRRGKALAEQGEAPVPAGQPVTVDPPATMDPPAPEGNLVAATQLASKALQGENEDDDAETFNLEVSNDNDNPFDEPSRLPDVTMNEATRLSVNPNTTVNMSFNPHDDDEDGGVFDISQTTGLTLAPQAAKTGVLPQKTSPAHSDRTLARPTEAARAPAPIVRSAAAPTRSSCIPTSKLPNKSVWVVESHTPTPPPPLSPPPSPPPSPQPSSPTPSSAQVTTPQSMTASIAHASLPPSQSAPPVAHPPITPFGATGSNIIWCGKTITPNEMIKLRSLAMRQAEGSQPRMSQMYKDLINILVTNPDYDPASDPLLAPNPPTATSSRSRKAATPASAPTPDSTSASATPAAPPPKAQPKAKRKPNMKAIPEPQLKLKPEPKPKPAPKHTPEPEPEPEPVDDDESALSDLDNDDTHKEPACTTSKNGTSIVQGGARKQQSKKAAGQAGGKGKAIAEGEHVM
ncbi:hypothetical protein FRC06_006780 [Ceratobasidium sp. 370]|nr:hypothetical protein FRC06_006780 [Ceratobasidium sp. 370]